MSALPGEGLLRDTGRNGGPRERGVRRARTRARGARARARRNAGGDGCEPSWSPGTRASARPGSPPSSPDVPAMPGSRSCSAARSISSARSCRTSRSPRRCVRSGSPGRPAGRRPARSCGCSRRRWRCSPGAPLLHRCCSCSRICTGPIPRRSIWSSSSRTTSATGPFCCSRPTAQTSPRRLDGCEDWPTGSAAPAPRSSSSSVRSSATSYGDCSRPAPIIPCLRR